jgi:hypothetical protein
MRYSTGKVALAAVMAACMADAPAAGGWTDENTALEVGYAVAATFDMLTTLDIKNHDDIEESGPAKIFLGRNPETLPTVGYFVGTTVLHYAVSRALPRGYREAWQGLTLVIEGGYAANNIRLGLSWSF